LRNEIFSIAKNEIEGTHECVIHLSDEQCVTLLVFLTDINHHLTVLNVKLQAKNPIISHLVRNIDVFRLKKKRFQVIRSFLILRVVNWLVKGSFPFYNILEEGQIITEFNTRFLNFYFLKENL